MVWRKTLCVKRGGPAGMSAPMVKNRWGVCVGLGGHEVQVCPVCLLVPVACVEERERSGTFEYLQRGLWIGTSCGVGFPDRLATAPQVASGAAALEVRSNHQQVRSLGYRDDVI